MRAVVDVYDAPREDSYRPTISHDDAVKSHGAQGDDFDQGGGAFVTVAPRFKVGRGNPRLIATARE